MNKVILTGRLTADIELRKTSSNKSVAKFSIAVDKGKDANGNRQCDFMRVVAWESKADFLNSYARKGTLIGVVGRIETSKYTGKDGIDRTEVYVRAEAVEILRQPAEKTENNTDYSQYNKAQYNESQNYSAKQSFTFDDINTDIDDEPWR